MTTITASAINAVLKLCIMGLVGFIAAKLGCLTEERTGALSKVLSDILLPAVILNACFSTYDPSRNLGYFFVLIGSFVIIGGTILICFPIFRRKGNPEWANDITSAAVSNAGFVGIPLISLMGDSDALFYIASYVLIVNVFLWTYSVLSYKEEMSLQSVKALFKSPTVIAIIVGVIIYFGRIPVPTIVGSAVSGIGAATGPISMFVTGAILSRTDIIGVMKKLNTYLVLIIKLAFQPMIAIIIAKLISVPSAAAAALIIGAACPAPTLTAVFSLLYGKDEKYAAGLLSLTMVLCVVAIPAALAIYEML